MKVVVIIGLLLAANVVWFFMISELRRQGYAVSYVNFLSDLKAYHSLIVDTRGHHDRHKFTFALVALYALVAGTLFAAVVL